MTKILNEITWVFYSIYGKISCKFFKKHSTVIIAVCDWRAEVCCWCATQIRQWNDSEKCCQDADPVE